MQQVELQLFLTLVLLDKPMFNPLQNMLKFLAKSLKPLGSWWGGIKYQIVLCLGSRRLFGKLRNLFGCSSLFFGTWLRLMSRIRLVYREKNGCSSPTVCCCCLSKKHVKSVHILNRNTGIRPGCDHISIRWFFEYFSAYSTFLVSCVSL